MATDTCVSVIAYQNIDDMLVEPFHSLRSELAYQMFLEEKTEVAQNFVDPWQTIPTKRRWVDHAAAQEYIDFVLLHAPEYNITIDSTSIEDL